MLSCLSVRNTLCVEFHTLTPEEAIKLGVDTVTDVREAIMTAPKIDIVRSEGADTSKPGELILGTSTNTTTTNHTESTTTAGVWAANSGNGSTTQTANQTQINGQLNIANGINTTVQIPEGNLKDQIAALSQQPGMGYLNDLASNPNIKWEQVKLAHDEWSYSQQGLTPAGAALLSIAIAVYTGGMGAELLGTTTTAAGAAVNAGFSALAASAGVSFVNNGGDIGKTLKDLGSKDSVKNIALAMVTAGVLSELNASLGLDKINAKDSTFGANLGKAVVNNLANAGVTSALTGTSLEDNIKTGLVSAFISAGSGQAANTIGDLTQDSQVLKALAHALAGCMAGGAAGGKQGCESGAIGAVVGELAAQWYDNPPNSKKPEEVLNFVKVVSAAAGAITGDGSAASVSTAVMTGVNAAQNNYLNHTQWKELSDKLKTCATEAECNQVRKEFAELSAKQDAAMREACKDLSSPTCRTKIAEAQVGSMTQKDLLIKGVLPESYWSTANDLNAVANGFAKQAFLSDLKTECARNPSCDAKKTAALTKLGSTVLDFTPVIGDIKAFVEAETPFDYLLATLGVAGPVGDSVAKALREGKALYKAGDIAGASAKLDEAKNIKDVNLANLVSPTNSGYLNKTKLGSAEMVVNTPTASQRLTISDVMANGDKYGTKTEALVNDVLKSDPSIKVLDGTKYGSNNGLDHVVQYVDPQTGKTMTMVIDSKQLAINGTTSLSSNAAGTAELGKNVLQLSDESLSIISSRLPDNSPAKIALDQAQKNDTLVKAVAYVDKTTGQLKIVPVTVPNAK